MKDAFFALGDRLPQWGPLGEITYLRTYARPLGLRREKWHETVDRATRYSGELGPVEEGEIKRLYDAVYDFRVFLAGRTLWTGGTDLVRRVGAANYNCAFTVLDSPRAFRDAALLLMVGSGVGGRALDRDASTMQMRAPLPDEAPKMTILPYEWVGYDSRNYTEQTHVVPVGSDTVRLVIGDSREGWAKAIEAYILMLQARKNIEISVNSVRPYGEPLKRFGGFASGPEPLVRLFRYAHLALFAENRPKGWTDIKLADLFNLLGMTIVSGGSRRSAQIILGNTPEFAEAKVGNWVSYDDVDEMVAANKIPEGVILPWRSQSNNSVVFEDHPGLDRIRSVVEHALAFGEPGFLNASAAKARRGDFEGVNPCAEILLRDKGTCNLVSVNMAAHVRGDRLDRETLMESIRLATRHAMRITNVDFGPDLDAWTRVQHEDRLIGVSLTGIVDAANMMNISPDHLIDTYGPWMRRLVKRAAKEYAEEMGVPTPVLHTTIKPEGTQSLLPGVSSGIHDPYAPYYIRRIRIAKADPLAEALVRQGFPHEVDAFNRETLVFEFPVKTAAKRSANEVPALELLKRYQSSMRSYVEHNTSITVTVGEEEADDVARWISDHWDNVVAVSLLPKQTAVYPQQPYEEISEERYREMVAKMPTFSRQVLDDIELERGASTSEVDADCETGVCPVR